MKRNIKRIALGIIGAILAAFVLPVAAAGQTHPRILRLRMEAGTATYEIYFAACLEDALFGNVTISRKPTKEELEAFLRTENLVLAVATDQWGEAQINFSEAALEDGVYLLTGESCEPFYICVPAPEGDGWAYTVDVYPGYQIGGEAEPKPSCGAPVTISAEAQATEAGEVGGVLLVMAACGVFFLRILRLEYW